MVKRIKKRAPKSKTEENVQEGVEVEVEGNVVGESEIPQTDDPIQSSEALKLEIAQNAGGASADRFSEVMEGFLLSLADNWVSALMVVAVGLGVYGFKQYSDASAHESFAEGRSQLEEVFKQYEALQYSEVRVLKQSSSAAEENILGLSVDPASEAEAPSAEAYTAVADQLKKLKLTSKSSPLVTLAEASTRFDSAKTAADFEAVAKMYTQVARNDNVEPIAQSLAFQNAAISYEEAAPLADDKAAMWKKAANAWTAMGKADPEIFDLKAQVNRARVLRTSGDLAGARKVYEGIKMLYAKELQDLKNSDLNQQIKLGLALTSGAKVADKK
jgi:hypothetical protein